MNIIKICNIILLSLVFTLSANLSSFSSSQNINNEKQYQGKIKFVLFDENTPNANSEHTIPTFDGRYIKSVTASVDKSNNAYVSIYFTKTGAQKLNKIIQINQGKKIGIMSDDTLLSSFPIKEYITDGKAIINNLSIQDALNLVLTINKTK